MSFSELLNRTRKEYKLSQMWMARFTGISRYKFSLMECGYYEPTDEELDKIFSKYPPSDELFDEWKMSVQGKL